MIYICKKCNGTGKQFPIIYSYVSKISRAIATSETNGVITTKIGYYDLPKNHKLRKEVLEWVESKRQFPDCETCHGSGSLNRKENNRQ